MDFSRLIRIIKEEVENFFNSEPSIADKIYQDKGIIPKQPEKIRGDVIGYVSTAWGIPFQRNQQPIPIVKNPKDLMDYDPMARGILVANGDLYLAQSEDALHYDIASLLAKQGIIPWNSVSKDYGDLMPREYVAVIRVMGTNRFTQTPNAYKELPEYYLEMFSAANGKHSSYKFLQKPIG
jgi:hypothetical protein